LGNEPQGQYYTPFAQTFKQGPLWHDFKVYGKKLPFNLLHVCDFMVDANRVHNPTPKFTIGKPIDFNDNGVMV
jgi:hypothetical protein